MMDIWAVSRPLHYIWHWYFKINIPIIILPLFGFTNPSVWFDFRLGIEFCCFQACKKSNDDPVCDSTTVLGNKIDLAERREVSQQRAEEFSEAQDMYYLETSAKESDNVEKLFLDLACRLIREARQNTLVNSVSSPLPGEGKSISYLTCCNFN